MEVSIAEALPSAPAAGLKPGPAQLALHEVLRVPHRDRDVADSGGRRNLYAVTGGRSKQTPLGRGINPIADHGRTGVTPAIVLSSSPWKAGSESTPWHDVFDLQNGHVRYFGDAKAGSARAAEDELGNRALLAEHQRHRAPLAADRAKSAPLLLFRAVSREGRDKGFREFCGLGIIERVERVVQWDSKSNGSFVNYAYDIVLLDLSAENELFDWRWINERALAGPQAAVKYAPLSWTKWVEGGERVLPMVQRRVARTGVFKREEQLPAPASADAVLLNQVYLAFADRKHAFESLASRIVGQILRSSGSHYVNGWITQASGDHGIDFVSRLDVGSGLASVKLVVLGQAKCTNPTGPPISAGDLARIVARLHRGWLGAYVTTATYSSAAQLELRMDEYPVLLVHGGTLASEVRLLAAEAYGGDVSKLLDELIAEHEAAILHRRPEEILDVDGIYVPGS